MIHTLGATLTVAGLVLATLTDQPSLAILGVALLALGAVLVLRLPEYQEH